MDNAFSAPNEAAIRCLPWYRRGCLQKTSKVGSVVEKSSDNTDFKSHIMTTD